jgi:hypothetical protein
MKGSKYLTLKPTLEYGFCSHLPPIAFSVTDKGKIVPVHAMKAHRRARGIAPLILNLSTRWK